MLFRRWEWISAIWNVDKQSPNKYGQPDSEGWMYGTSFERLINHCLLIFQQSWSDSLCHVATHHLFTSSAFLIFSSIYDATHPSGQRLNEAIRTGNGSGVASKTSIVRKRRWTRSIRCVSAEILQQIRNRTMKIQRMRTHIEQTLKEKEIIIKNIKAYEEKRWANDFCRWRTVHYCPFPGWMSSPSHSMSLLKELLTR